MNRRRPLQVFVDANEAAALEVWSRQHGLTKSDALRAAIRGLVRGPETDPLLAASGMIRGGPADMSERIDHYLMETFVERKAPPTSRRRNRRRIRR